MLSLAEPILSSSSLSYPGSVCPSRSDKSSERHKIIYKFLLVSILLMQLFPLKILCWMFHFLGFLNQCPKVHSLVLELQSKVIIIVWDSFRKWVY